jgi:hypothetical protein
MGLDYGTPLLAGHGVWPNMQAIRSLGIPHDLFYKHQGKVQGAYVSDMMVHLFHLVSQVTSGGKHTATIQDLFEAIRLYVCKALFRFSVCVLCFDVKTVVPVSKRPIQATRRSKNDPLTKEQYKQLRQNGVITSWNAIRSTTGAMAWILQQLEIWFRTEFEMPQPRDTQDSVTLIVHGLADQPGQALNFELVNQVEAQVEKGTIDVPVIGEGEIQVVYWLDTITKYMPVVAVSIDKDTIALALLALMRQNQATRHPCYVFRHGKLFHSIVDTPKAQNAFARKPYRSCPDLTANPHQYDKKVKITQLPFLDMKGFSREIEAMFKHHKVNVTCPQATWVLFMVFVGCDFVDKKVLHNLNGERLLEGYLKLGKHAPSVLRLTLDDADKPFKIEFAEKVFLRFVFYFLKQHNAGKKKGCIYNKKRVKVAARQAFWVVSYWANAILGSDHVPNPTLLDEDSLSYWGWTDEDLVVEEVEKVSKTLVSDHSRLVKKIERVATKRKRAGKDVTPAGSKRQKNLVMEEVFTL